MLAIAKHRKMFESVKVPAQDAGVSAGESDVVAMIDSIEVAPVDFHIANSEDEKLAINEARALLVQAICSQALDV